MLLILRKAAWLLNLLAVFAALALSELPLVQAQGNLLQDPSFETTQTYKRVAEDTDGTYFDVPPAWEGWILRRSAGDEEWRNRVPTGFPHTGLFKIDQSRSFHISRGYATFTTAVYQTVTVPDGANVQGSARGFMERGSAGPTPGGSFRVGLDPNGGSNPLDPAIVWSNTVTTDDAWVQASTSATASATTVTLFLYAAQTEPVDPNGIYWDDASLTVGGEGGSVPGVTPGETAVIVPTPAFAPYVEPQSPQADGSIVHTVAAGDTLSSIAVAYGVTNEEILELNDLASARFLQIGQRLTIRLSAPSGSSSSDIVDEDDEDEEDDDDDEAVDDAAEGEVATSTRRAPATTDADEDETEEATVEPTDESTEPSETAEAEPTERSATVTDAPPAPVTQVAQSGGNVTGVCITLFEDVNQNRIREDGEGLLAGGTITLTFEGQALGEYETDGASEPHCFEELAIGVYTAAAQPPEGYGLTTAAQFSVRVQSGQTVNVIFGAGEGVEVAILPTANSVDAAADDPGSQVVIPQTTEDSENNALMQNLGLIAFGAAGFVLIFGVGVALALRRR